MVAYVDDRGMAGPQNEAAVEFERLGEGREVWEEEHRAASAPVLRRDRLRDFGSTG